MRSRFLTWAAVAALGFGASFTVGSARAEDRAARPAVLDDAGLLKLLEGLGYVMKDLGNQQTQLTVEQGNRRWYVTVGLSGSGSYVWFSANLGDLPPLDQIPAARLDALLDYNGQWDAAHFYVNDKLLQMARAMLNRGVTAVILRREIEAMASRVGSTAAAWDSEGWNAPPAKAPSPTPVPTPTPTPSPGK